MLALICVYTYTHNDIFNLFFDVFAYIMIGQCSADRKQNGKRETGAGKLLQSGFELGTLVA